MKWLQSFAVVGVAYILAHGLTAFLITPVQMRLLPEITSFASLIYLPHGVRVLSTWLLGRIAFIPLAMGAFLSELLFTPAEFSTAWEPHILLSIAVGAASSIVAFEVLRLAGRNLYAGQSYRVHWTWLLVVGGLASVLNSIGQAVVFSGSLLSGQFAGVLLVYALGDLCGLVVTTLALMLVFRRMRLGSSRG
ncbi:hypothetical protein [Pseudooceanicola nanhaiensis]|uniref:hypothetical protein n=1 Tax=Pseudooceanicola nanhaiensis TaxID=375761 RepID=UPI001CD7FFEC|nr:hypothetical protein [Pseudooceanicola nanhaiensis]MCA0920452.1 hypothetical protein [Pseudooceanicola nanhaiensis]